MHSLLVPPGGLALTISDMHPEHTLYVDGSVKRGRLGGGAILVTPEGEHSHFWQFEQTSRDSNQAEILALYHALHWVAVAGPLRPLQVYTDSYELLLHLTKKSARYHGLLELFPLFLSCQVVLLQNIANDKNKKADVLARKALGLK